MSRENSYTMKFHLKSTYSPTGDQPQAIEKLSNSVLANNPHQTLIGVTGSGKTFTIANIIQNTKLPTLVVSHNKTLASQLYQEFRDYFPKNAVSYFVSYYDYYQPEAYIPQTDTYIEKEANINAEIDKLRLTTTANLVTRPDCIVIASVSCIYNLGSPLEYEKFFLEITPGQLIDRQVVISRLTDLQYQRTIGDLLRGSFRVIGDVLQLYPAYEDIITSLTFTGNTLKTIDFLDPLNFTPVKKENQISHQTMIYPAKHYLTRPSEQKEILATIRSDLANEVTKFKKDGRLLEAQRLEQKVNYDLSMIEEFGFVNGIENYSRYFDGRNIGDPPYTLLDYFSYNAKKFGHQNFLTVVDESHISLPQIRGMYHGDQSRKDTLIDYGFRLPAARDNRPLNFTEFQHRTPVTLYSSATPNEYELGLSRTSQIPTIAEQLIRPTGLLDPVISVRPSTNQIQNLLAEINARKVKGERVLILTLTKRTAEDLTEYLKNSNKDNPLKVAYLHSDVKTLDRSDIIDSLRLGEYDCLVGINLLREGLDLPEVSLVAILDTDKEGFLRTTTALIQTMGRAARHVNGEVILYADKVSESMRIAIEETTRRRDYQITYNQKHGITPLSIQKPIRDKLLKRDPKTDIKTKDEFKNIDPESLTPQDKRKLITKLKKLMTAASKAWDFETAARYRDHIQKLS
jgi:excinuclease ABC subunit B